MFRHLLAIFRLSSRELKVLLYIYIVGPFKTTWRWPVTAETCSCVEWPLKRLNWHSCVWRHTVSNFHTHNGMTHCQVVCYSVGNNDGTMNNTTDISRKGYWPLCTLHFCLVGYRSFTSFCNWNKPQYFLNCKCHSLEQWLGLAVIAHRFWKLMSHSAGTRKSKSKKVKVKCSCYRPGVAQRRGRGIALLFHDHGTRRGWVVSSTHRPYFTPGKDPLPILQEAGWALGPVWTGGKSHPHRDSIPDRPAHSQPLYRLSYGQAQRVPGSSGPQISWQRHRMVVGCQSYTPAAFTPQEILLVLISVRGWVDPRAIVRSEGFYVYEKFTDTSWDRTFRFVAQHLNHCANAVPKSKST